MKCEHHWLLPSPMDDNQVRGEDGEMRVLATCKKCNAEQLERTSMDYPVSFTFSEKRKRKQ